MQVYFKYLIHSPDISIAYYSDSSWRQLCILYICWNACYAVLHKSQDTNYNLTERMNQASSPWTRQVNWSCAMDGEGVSLYGRT